jgi:energy-coupling factor transporter transmembrane protein EcfT
MIRGSLFGSLRRPVLVETSPLRRADPRTKLVLSLCGSLAVMLPLEQLAVFMAIWAGFLLWARLLPAAARQVWRIRWLLIVLGAVEWLMIGPSLAAVITLRLILLSGVLTLFVGTTTPEELRLALESLRVPYRYAFSLSLAFQSVGLLEEEWQAIREAQRARGALPTGPLKLRTALAQVRDLVAITVPAIVLTTRRAWAMTEAAYARGFDAPHRRPYRKLAMTGLDWLLLAGAIIVGAAWVLWRRIVLFAVL